MDIEQALEEETFPGNRATFAQLLGTFDNDEVCGFVGAGVSIPLAPSWTQLLTSLIAEAQEVGKLSIGDGAELRAQVDKDPLEVASVLEEIWHKEQFRQRLARSFRIGDNYTPLHEIMFKLPLRGLITTNYDAGLSNAYVARLGKMPNVMSSSNSGDMLKWSQQGSENWLKNPLFHLHGKIDEPHDIILTSDDYDQFYADTSKYEFIRSLWRDKRLLVIGFSFTDPFITRAVENVMRTLQSEDRHFALISHRGDEQISPLKRRQFSKKYRLQPIFYRVLTNDRGEENHSALLTILEALVPNDPGDGNKVSSSAGPSLSGGLEASEKHGAAKTLFESALFTNSSGKVLYVEPRIFIPDLTNRDYSVSPEYLTLDQIVDAEGSFLITAPHEYGSTSLGRRLSLILTQRNINVAIENARELPNFQKKLRTKFASMTEENFANNVLILDNFSPEMDEKLIKEIIGTGIFGKFIALHRGSQTHLSSHYEWNDTKFTTLGLSNLHRADLRTLCQQYYETSDTDLISSAVDKIYSDLLSLAIPLTPPNVIMYMSIMNREGDFTPLGRVQIIERYITDLLRRPADVLSDSYSVSRIDVLSVFADHLFTRRMTSFRTSDWENFCQSYMSFNLVHFPMTDLLADLVQIRVFEQVGSQYAFKYRLFFCYFLGRHIANRPEELSRFLEAEHHLSIEGLVEVISGLAVNSTSIINDLSSKLDDAICSFYEKYDISSFDPYTKIPWISNEDEEDRLWAPVTKSIESGPAATAEIDTVKRSYMAEIRTESQLIIIKNFESIERSVSDRMNFLLGALSNANELQGTTKLRALKAVIEANAIIFRIGVIFSPYIARSKHFMWNDILYTNALEYGPEEENDLEKATQMVVQAIPNSIARRAADRLGSKKLGEAYKVLAKDEPQGFYEYLLFVLILRSKPSGWVESARKLILASDRHSVYLFYMTMSALEQFRLETNTTVERNELKQLVATIRAKRDSNRDTPKPRAILNTLSFLERSNFFAPGDG